MFVPDVVWWYVFCVPGHLTRYAASECEILFWNAIRIPGTCYPCQEAVISTLFWASTLNTHYWYPFAVCSINECRQCCFCAMLFWYWMPMEFVGMRPVLSVLDKRFYHAVWGCGLWPRVWLLQSVTCNQRFVIFCMRFGFLGCKFRSCLCNTMSCSVSQCSKVAISCRYTVVAF